LGFTSWLFFFWCWRFAKQDLHWKGSH
jgi:hypothetical protein